MVPAPISQREEMEAKTRTPSLVEEKSGRGGLMWCVFFPPGSKVPAR